MCRPFRARRLLDARDLGRRCAVPQADMGLPFQGEEGGGSDHSQRGADRGPGLKALRKARTSGQVTLVHARAIRCAADAATFGRMHLAAGRTSR